MRRIQKIISLLSLLVLINLIANAQNFLSKTVWLNDTQSPVQVNTLLQDNIGYIWLGTNKGLYKYNGRTFKSIKNSSHSCISALASKEGKVWVGFKNGEIGIAANDIFHKKTFAGDQINSPISAINIVMASTLIVSTKGEGIYLINNGYSIRISSKNGLSDDYIYSILSADNRLLLAASDKGINEILFNKSTIKVTKFNTKKGLPDNIVTSMRPMKKKCWSWLGTHQGGIALYCSKEHHVWTPKTSKKWSWGKVNDILPLEDGKAIVCTENGNLLTVQINKANSLEVVDHKFPNEQILCMIQDNTGNIWCGTKTGLKLLTINTINTINIPPPYNLSQLTAITYHDSTIWFAIDNSVYRISCKNSNQHPYLINKFKVPITKLHVDKMNCVWAGSYGDGLFCKEEHGQFEKVGSIPILADETILDISSSNNNLWVSGLNGVQQIDISNTPKLIRTHNKQSGVGSDYVYQIKPDKKGSIWLATDGAGACRYYDGEYTTWDSTQGMISDVIYGIEEDSKGNIWASTINKGLLKLHNGKWINYGNKYGLQNLMISSIASDSSGHIYVVNSTGIEKYYLNDKQFIQYNNRNGLGLDSFSSALNLYTKDRYNNIFIPYQDGLIYFQNSSFNKETIPNINIRHTSSIAGEKHYGKTSFNYSENYITVHYEGINLASSTKPIYRYKLIGYDSNWVITNDESVTFPTLSPGKYRFVAQTSLNNNFLSSREASRTFVIKKPLWMETWFIILVASVLITTIVYLIRLREKNLTRLSSLQKERMIFEYEHLKSQVNPHFLFNSLNTLSSLIEDDKNVAQLYTEQLSDLYRNMLSHKDKDLLSFKEEWEIIQNYLYIQKIRFGDALKINIDFDENAIASKRVVPMSLQLLIENAIKHNIVSKSQPLIIDIYTERDYITIKNTFQPKLSKEDGASLGLINIKKRYSHITKKNVYIKNNKQFFIVSIPLL